MSAVQVFPPSLVGIPSVNQTIVSYRFFDSQISFRTSARNRDDGESTFITGYSEQSTVCDGPKEIVTSANCAEYQTPMTANTANMMIAHFGTSPPNETS